jgi:hypothetical protein
MDIETIPIKELSHLLRITDIRSIRRWCNFNGVTLLKDTGSRSLYVMRSEYQAGRLKAFIKHLKEQHGDNWLKAYQAHVEFNLELLSASKGIKTTSQLKVKKGYQKDKTGRNEQRFLDEIINLSITTECSNPS